MKTTKFLWGLLSSLWLLTSCQQEQVDTTSWLKVDANDVIQLESGTSETIIPVSTSDGRWAATCNASWLEAKQVGNNLLINATSNESLETRHAQIIVTSGTMSKSLLIEQTGYPSLVVETSPTKIVFGQPQGEMRVLLKTNAQSWTVENTADWLEVVALERVGELVLRAKANETIQTRTADLVITVPNHQYTLKVKQKGKLHFFLPVFAWGKNLDDIIPQERSRGSRITITPNPQANPRIPDYTFTTISKAFPQVKYEFLSYGDKLLYATTLLGEATLIYSQEFLDFLKEEGFERVTPETQTSGLIKFIHKGNHTELYIYALTDKKTKKLQGYVSCRPIVEQPQAMPTLDNLNLGIQRFGEATKKDVEDWETTQGGKYDAEFSSLFGIPFYFVPDPFYARGYFFDKKDEQDPKSDDVVSEYIVFYEDYTKGFYRFGAMDYITREFNELMQREGFQLSFYNPSSRGYVYSNPQKHINIITRTMNLRKGPMLRMNIYYVPPKVATNGTPTSLDNTDRILIRE